MASKTRQAENLKSAEQAIKKGKKCASKGLFKRADMEGAANHYREATKLYQKSGDSGIDSLLAALKLSADAHAQTGSAHTAAKDMEAAAGIYAKKKGDKAMACKCYQDAAQYFRVALPDKCAAILIKAAEMVAESDPDLTITLLNESVAVFEEEERGKFAADSFRKCITIAIKAERYQDAMDLLVRQNKTYEKIGDFETDIYRNVLCSTIIKFHMEDYKAAEAEHKTNDEILGYNMSKEWEAAQGLIDAYRAGSQENLEENIKSCSIFKYIPAQVARMARKMHLSDDVIAAGGGGGSDDDDSDDGPIDLS